MARKENVKSLKMYFILVAILVIWSGIKYFDQAQGDFTILLSAIIQIGLGIAYLSVGILFKKLLINSPKIILNLILINLGLLILSVLVSLPWNNLYGEVLVIILSRVVFGVLITWYLYQNVKRVSNEEQGKNQTSLNA